MTDNNSKELIKRMAQGIAVMQSVWHESEAYFSKLEKEVIFDKDKFEEEFRQFVQKVFSKGEGYNLFFNSFNAEFLNFHYYTHDDKLLRATVVSKRFQKKEEDIKEGKFPYIGGFEQITKMIPIQLRFEKDERNNEGDYVIIPSTLTEELKGIRQEEMAGGLSEDGINNRLTKIWEDNKKEKWYKDIIKYFKRVPLHIHPDSWKIFRLIYDSSKVTLKWLVEGKLSLPRTILFLPVIVGNKQVGGAALVSSRLFDREEMETLLWIFKEFLAYLKVRELEEIRLEKESAEKRAEEWLNLSAGMRHTIGGYCATIEVYCDRVMKMLEELSGEEDIKRRIKEDLSFLKAVNQYSAYFSRFMSTLAEFVKGKGKTISTQKERLKEFIEECFKEAKMCYYASTGIDVSDFKVEFSNNEDIEIEIEMVYAPLRFTFFELSQNTFKYGKSPLKVSLETKDDDVIIKFENRLQRTDLEYGPPSKGGGTNLGHFVIEYFINNFYCGKFNVDTEGLKKGIFLCTVVIPKDLKKKLEERR